MPENDTPYRETWRSVPFQNISHLNASSIPFALTLRSSDEFMDTSRRPQTAPAAASPQLLQSKSLNNIKEHLTLRGRDRPCDNRGCKHVLQELKKNMELVASLQTSISEASAELERISATLPEVDEKVAAVREDTITLERQLTEKKNTYNIKSRELEALQEESSATISRMERLELQKRNLEMERLRQVGAPLASTKRLEKAEIQPMKFMTIDKKSISYRYHTGIYKRLNQFHDDFGWSCCLNSNRRAPGCSVEPRKVNLALKREVNKWATDKNYDWSRSALNKVNIFTAVDVVRPKTAPTKLIRQGSLKMN